MKKFLVLALVLSLLTACAGGSSASVDGTWKLISYGPAANPVPAVTDVETSIEFKDGQVNGSVGCNSFGGGYKVDGDTITFEQMMSTLMFCEGPVGDQETTTLNVMNESTTFTLDGDTLTITSADGSSVVVLARQ